MLSKGDWVQVREAADIPAVLRDNKPTRGRVEDVFDDATYGAGEKYVGVLVPIGDEDVDVHSQYVPYRMVDLVVVNDDRC